MTITSEFYTNLDRAYAFFNDRFWGGALPPCLMTLQRERQTMGYYTDKAFGHVDGGDQFAHELALNPNMFDMGDRETLATLVHEMVHVWHYNTSGKQPTPGYHDRVWGAEMKRIGLHPSSTGAEGGKETGWKMSDYVIPGGMFEAAVKELLDSGYRVIWRSTRLDDAAATAGKKRSKVKYECPQCEQKVWGKPGAFVCCGTCSLGVPELVIMVGDSVEGDENAD